MVERSFILFAITQPMNDSVYVDFSVYILYSRFPIYPGVNRCPDVLIQRLIPGT